MATITDAELRFDAAVELGLVQEGDGALIDDWDQYLTKKSRQVRATLQAQELCWWLEDEIPDDVSLPLTYLVATAARGKWGKEYDQSQAGYALLREVGAKRPSGERTKAKYF